MIQMNRYIYGIYAGLTLLFSACTQQENTDCVEENSHKIIVHFDIPDAGAPRSAETIDAVEGRESLLKTIDVFIFSGNDKTPSDETELTYHERVSGTGHEYTLQADKRQYTGTSVVYVLANVPEENASSFSTVRTYGDFKDLKLEKSICNPYADDEYHFLMDGKSSPIQISTADKVDVALERAAAKVDVILSLPENWGTTPTDEQFTWAENNPSSGYWVNPPMTVFLSAEKNVWGQTIKYGSNTSADNIAAVDQEYQGKKRFVLYSYAAAWQGGDFDHETYLILNLPINIDGEEQQNNYYKVRINQNTSGILNIERNKHYKINITVGTKGSTTPEKAVELTGSVGVFDWISHDINIDDGDNTKFLVLSEEIIEFYNSDENQIVEYASSSPIQRVHIKGIDDEYPNDAPYYYDQFGKKQLVDNINYPTAAFTTADGHIKIESELLKNCAPKHYIVVVTNTEGITKEFSVVQYPLEYITSEQSFQSYRKDVIKRGEIITYENIQQLQVKQEETYYPFDNNFGFYNKYVLKNTESGGRHTLAYNYYWSTRNGGRISYSTQRNENARIYHITITRTSNDYVLAVPSVADDGTTATDKDNQEKVSPSFMIASRLGFFENKGSNGADYEWAKKHCNNYVEVTEDGKIYDDWRLPTPAELKIIFTYQLNKYGSVIDELLIPNYNYWGAGAAVRYDGRNEPEIVGDATRGAIRCVRDAYRNTESQN